MFVFGRNSAKARNNAVVCIDTSVSELRTQKFIQHNYMRKQDVREAYA